MSNTLTHRHTHTQKPKCQTMTFGLPNLVGRVGIEPTTICLKGRSLYKNNTALFVVFCIGMRYFFFIECVVLCFVVFCGVYTHTHTRTAR